MVEYIACKLMELQCYSTHIGSTVMQLYNSTCVFGVSKESMQLSFDSRGNSVPTILLMMQRRLYEQGGLQAEGIFRINADNSQEEYVREQLNSGVVPNDIDVHCLAGLIKNGVDMARSMEKPSTLDDVTEKNKQPWQLTEIIDPAQCRLVAMPDSTDAANKVARLLYTNSGVGVLALGSNGIQKLWKWVRSEQNPNGKVSTLRKQCHA